MWMGLSPTTAHVTATRTSPRHAITMEAISEIPQPGRPSQAMLARGSVSRRGLRRPPTAVPHDLRRRRPAVGNLLKMFYLFNMPMIAAAALPNWRACSEKSHPARRRRSLRRPVRSLGTASRECFGIHPRCTRFDARPRVSSWSSAASRSSSSGASIRRVAGNHQGDSRHHVPGYEKRLSG